MANEDSFIHKLLSVWTTTVL